MTNIETVRDKIAWSYANLARAHVALLEGSIKYTKTHHIIRSRLFKGLVTGRMSMRSLYDDERLKMTLPQCCSYCGSRERLSLDHLIPRIKGGSDEADNIVWACRSCNSSKNGREMLRWMNERESFPSIYLLRRYIKIVMAKSESLCILDNLLIDFDETDYPFSIKLLPVSFPPLEKLFLFVHPIDQ
jgi:hypothetical protein